MKRCNTSEHAMALITIITSRVQDQLPLKNANTNVGADA